MIWRALTFGIIAFALARVVRSAMASKSFEMWAKLTGENNLIVPIRCPAQADTTHHLALLSLRDFSWRCDHCRVTGWLTRALDARTIKP